MVQTGSKSLLFPDVPQITNLQQVEDYLRRIMDILEELNRRQWENVQEILSRAGGTPYLAQKTGAGAAPTETGWYDCTIYKSRITNFAAGGAYNTSEPFGTGVVLNLICWAHIVEALLNNTFLLCWPLGMAQTSGGYWVGIELFGRATIGLCE
jgi:hypothetical protein